MMSKQDIAAIKIGGDAFTSKWWTKKRAIQAHGSGVGKALDQWDRVCPDDPLKLKTPADVKAARDAAEDLKTALAKAKQKCGKLATDTAAACDRYIKLINDYLSELSSSDEEGEVVERIKAALPGVLKAMSKADEAMSDAIEDCQSLHEVIIHITERAEIRAKMPVHGSTEDLKPALREVEKKVGALMEFLNREAVGFTRLADPIVELEGQIKSSAHAKDFREFHSLEILLGKREGKLRDAVTDLDLLFRKASDRVNKVEVTVGRVRDQMENITVRFWDSPVGSAEQVNLSITETLKAANGLVKAGKPQDERGRVELGKSLRNIDAEILQIDANVTNLGNSLKMATELVKQFPTDKSLTSKVKEMAGAVQVIKGLKSQLDVAIKTANDLVER